MQKADFKNKKVLDWDYWASSNLFCKKWSYLDACDIYDKHLALMQSETMSPDLFKNVRFNMFDVSGVSKNIAEVTGWFPTEVPKADEL